jgi:hypothetical protein
MPAPEVKERKKPGRKPKAEKKPEPEVKERKKPGRKPKAEKKPEPEVKERKKPGRKPKAEKKPEPEVKERKKPGRKPKAETPAPAEKPAKKVRADLKDKPLPELVAMKDAKKDNDLVTLAAYYINKNQKKREFRSSDILEVLKENNLPEPANVNYHLRKLSDDRGLLTHGKKQGRYKISDQGVKWVEYN